MPVISIHLGELERLVGQPLDRRALEERLPLMGSSIERMEGDTWDVEFFPNRPDLYSVEGVARALRAFLGIRPGLARYRVSPSTIRFNVDPSVAEVRPEVVGGVVRVPALGEETLRSLIDLQEKLHLTLGRRRAKVAVGIHDLDRVEPPFTYRAVEPAEVRFVPLGMDREMDLGEVLREHDKGREFAWILGGKERYPIIQDSRGNVLSFPPIINGTLTALTPKSRNLFVDVTGTSRDPVRAVLNIIAAALAERGGKISSVMMGYPAGEERTPDLTPTDATMDLAPANQLLGLALDAPSAKLALERMGYGVTMRGRRVGLKVPAYRADVLHPVDFAEDMAIGHGVEKFALVLPKAATTGATARAYDVRAQVREIMIGYGFQEIHTLELLPKATPFQPSEPPTPVVNAIGEDTATVRSALLPSILEILKLNKRRDLPQRIFEIADVAVKDRNEMHLGVAVIDSRVGFTDIKGLVQGLGRDLGLSVEVEAREDPNFLPGRCAAWRSASRDRGYFGELHPRVVTGYELSYPVVALEATLEGL